jgi:hypothetical protein
LASRGPDWPATSSVRRAERGGLRANRTRDSDEVSSPGAQLLFNWSAFYGVQSAQEKAIPISRFEHPAKTSGMIPHLGSVGSGA